MVPVEVDPATVASVFTVVSFAYVRVRRLRSTAVRLALSDARPDVRRAAVLVAGRHGLSRYGRALSRTIRHEESDEILATLAEVVRDGEEGRHRPPRKLRKWSQGFASGSETCSSSDAREAPRPPRCIPKELPLVAGGIDALEAFEAATSNSAPALPAGQAGASLLPAPVWKAAPGQLDPLAVLASLEQRPFTTTTQPVPVDGRGPGARRRADPEALVDRLAGIAPKRSSHKVR